MGVAMAVLATAGWRANALVTQPEFLRLLVALIVSPPAFAGAIPFALRPGLAAQLLYVGSKERSKRITGMSITSLTVVFENFGARTALDLCVYLKGLAPPHALEIGGSRSPVTQTSALTVARGEEASMVPLFGVAGTPRAQFPKHVAQPIAASLFTWSH
jgi:hypothetical protein